MLTLIVPGLVLPRQALADLTQGMELPALALCLGRGRRRRRPPESTEALLAAAFGLPSPLPAAALRDPGHEGNGHALCLDPVHLRFEERTLIVDDPASLALDADEAAQLAAALAPVFAGLGSLHVLTPACWNLRLADAAPGFEPLPDARLRRADPLPLGPAHAPWRAALHEAQMVLHDHPVNQARAAAGRPLVNSLWPWGGGALPPLPPLPASPAAALRHDAIWSDDLAHQGIGRWRGLPGQSLPDCLPSALPSRPLPALPGRRTLAVFDALDLPARSGNGLAWRDGLQRLETGWLAPALAALRAGTLDGLRLIAPGDQGNERVTVSKLQLWQFWRRPAPVTSLAP